MLVLQVQPLPSCVCNRQRADCLLSLYSILFDKWMLFLCLYPPSSQNLSSLSSVLVHPIFQSCGHSGHCPLGCFRSVCVHLELQCSNDMILQMKSCWSKWTQWISQCIACRQCSCLCIWLWYVSFLQQRDPVDSYSTWDPLWSLGFFFLSPEEVPCNRLSSLLYLQSLGIPAEL